MPLRQTGYPTEPGTPPREGEFLGSRRRVLPDIIIIIGENDCRIMGLGLRAGMSRAGAPVSVIGVGVP